MKIIERIEINYFRSTYSVDLKDLDDFNILIGNNDSGKSNILKALNLFFNNQTELEQPFFFLDDLTRKRESEARTAKGRATIWIKVYFNNFLGWKSLPQKFSVKKSWNRYSDYPETTYPKDISSIQIAKFLNKISFHYIPAIRGRNVFSHFMTMLHDHLFDDKNVSLISSTSSLIEIINENTSDMSYRIQKGVGIRSVIQPPTDLRVLFNALDFSTNYINHNIPLQKRGDGIQSRHIPFILDFIAKNSNKYYIWAYEEPETSLEMGAAFELAKQFKDEFSQENQIFITTHSPAFYDLSSENITKWYVYQDINNHDAETRVERTNLGNSLDHNLGVAALISERAKEAYELISRLQKDKERLDSEIQKSRRPHIIVEGVTDKIILETAYKKLYPRQDTLFDFIEAAGAKNIPLYLKSRKVLSQNVDNIIIGLFDNDQEGRKQMSEFTGVTLIENTGFMKISSDKELYVGLLPLPIEIIKIIDNDSGSISDLKFPVPIEFMFPPELITEAIDSNILVLEDRIAKANDPELPTDINLTDYYSSSLPRAYRFLAQKVRSSTKKEFADWVQSKEAQHFENFRCLFEQLSVVTKNTSNTHL